MSTLMDVKPGVWTVRAAILVSIALSGVAVVGVVLERLESMSAPVPSVHGLRLGATVDEVRAAREGEWTSRVDQSGDLLLSRDGESYWFHEAGLVAMDVTVLPEAADASGPRLTVTDGSVLTRTQEGAGVRVRLISRTCPTHAQLAEALVAGSGN